jgi:mRNA interferase HigB
MVIISYKSLREYSEQQPRAEAALEDWYAKTTQAQWSTITDVRNTFGYADNIGGERVVFNICGNHYRLIAAINYRANSSLSAHTKNMNK